MPLTFAAIAPVIGGIAEEEAITDNVEFPLSVLLINGRKDPLVPFKGGGVGFRHRRGRVIGAFETFNFWKTVCGIKNEPYISYIVDKQSQKKTVKVFSAIGGRMNTEVILYVMIYGGHVFPGKKSGPLRKFLVGEGCNTLNAEDLIYNFFINHPQAQLP